MSLYLLNNLGQQPQDVEEVLQSMVLAAVKTVGCFHVAQRYASDTLTFLACSRDSRTRATM